CHGKLLFGPARDADGATAAQSQEERWTPAIICCAARSSSTGRRLLRSESESDLTQDDAKATCVS
ncbi:unnamed protein product, partial [Musa hybrid cultivar]